MEKVAAKLDLYNSACPHTTQIANYWLCRAKIAQKENDFDRVVCLYEQALVFKAQVFYFTISFPFPPSFLVFRYKSAKSRTYSSPST